MYAYWLILGGLWAVFIAVWFVGALSTKRTVHRSWGSIWWRVGIAASVIVLVNLLWGSPYITGAVPIPTLNIVGLILAALGIVLAIWARVYLGRNWGMPQVVKEHPTLVTTGPYAYIRHPIYAGILTALFGSGFVIWWWFVVFAWSLVYFLAFAMPDEEALLQKEFPDTYPAYRARTKRLIPFVW